MEQFTAKYAAYKTDPFIIPRLMSYFFDKHNLPDNNNKVLYCLF